MAFPKPNRIFYRAISIPVSLFAVAVAHFLQTPNPMMILIIPVVFFCYTDGYISGAISGLISIFYAMIFFSNPDQLFTYERINIEKILTIAAAVTIIVALMGKLKEKDNRAVREKETHLLEMRRINAELDEAMLAAQNASKAKSHFLSSVSHDIRTPMNVILGMTNLALDDLDDPEAVRDHLEKINSSGNFLLGLINDVLDMAKIESGELELYPEKYCFQEFRRDIETIFQPLCRQKGITLSVELGELENKEVVVDKVRFKQIFFNLLSNAVKFTSAGGSVNLTVQGRGELHGVLPCVFAVRDSGVGMSREFQERMFEPFTQERNALSGQSQGSGLGLRIVKSIIETMGGEIEVRSAEGEGTTFLIKLDLEAADQSPEVAPSPEAAAGKWENALQDKNILVVDDNPLNCKINMRLLMKMGAVVTCAENGLKALEAFEQSPTDFFAAILMDIQMPVMDGLEAAARIRALDREDARTVPMIAMTANAFGEDVAKSLESGMNKHLTKPATPAQLYETLTSLME